ncbi:MAG: YccF domain-containing protein [Clostridia bacterium]|nr:YccF domain-containing protein [Clostridia bacterium]
MKTLGNIVWMLFGGIVDAILWGFAGVIWCVTLVGIPFGKQCFKFARLSLAPFGKEVQYGGGAVSLLANVAWLIFFGVPMALVNLFFGVLLCVTLVGIPFGIQQFKMMKLSLMPFGARITNKS